LILERKSRSDSCVPGNLNPTCSGMADVVPQRTGRLKMERMA